MNGTTQIDARSGSDTCRAKVIVIAPLPNRSPMTVGQISPPMLTEGGPTVEVDVSKAFQDPDCDELSYAPESSDIQVATAEVDGAKLNVKPGDGG